MFVTYIIMFQQLRWSLLFLYCAVCCNGARHQCNYTTFKIQHLYHKTKDTIVMIVDVIIIIIIIIIIH